MKNYGCMSDKSTPPNWIVGELLLSEGNTEHLIPLIHGLSKSKAQEVADYLNTARQKGREDKALEIRKSLYLL